MAVSYSGLHPALRNLVRNLPRFARYYGFQYRITSAYRSPYKQARLYQDYLAGRTPYVVAPPGASLHEKGMAIDIVATDPQKLVSLLTSAGLSWGGPSDPVHFSLSGLKSQATKKFSFTESKASWERDVGSSIPAELTYLPGVGGLFSIMKSPIGYAKQQVNRLIDVALAFL